MRMMLLVLVLVAAGYTVLSFSGCASSDDGSPEQRAKENAGVAGAGAGESKLNEHGGIAW
jgi:hypothetical protein